MNEQIVKTLEELRNDFQRIRDEKMATGITIHTLIGDYPIKNQQVVVTVLDLLIKEANDQIRKIINE